MKKQRWIVLYDVSTWCARKPEKQRDGLTAMWYIIFPTAVNAGQSSSVKRFEATENIIDIDEQREGFKGKGERKEHILSNIFDISGKLWGLKAWRF